MSDAAKKPLLTIQDLITSSGKYPERAKSKELTDEVRQNMQLLLAAVNPFLEALGITSVKVSSGFRPSAVNAATPGSAKRSLHMIGKAVDLEDPNNSLDKKIEAHPELLEKFGLWLESPKATPSWAHLDIGTRTARKIRIFLP